MAFAECDGKTPIRAESDLKKRGRLPHFTLIICKGRGRRAARALVKLCRSYSTVTLFARLRGLSGSLPKITAVR